MNLPHLKQVESNKQFELEVRRELRKPLRRGVDIYGPAYVLDVLWEVLSEWGPPKFEVPLLQRKRQLLAIKEAAWDCRHADRARFAVEERFGLDALTNLFDREE